MDNIKVLEHFLLKRQLKTFSNKILLDNNITDLLHKNQKLFTIGGE